MSNSEEKSLRRHSTLFQLTLIFISILLGVFLTFIPNLTVQTLCNIFSILLSAAGIIAIAFYFISGSWKRLDDYMFALGMLLLVLGICGMLRVETMASRFHGYVGFLILLICVLAMQDMIHLRAANHSLWLPVLVLSLLTLFLGITVILELEFLLSLLRYWVLILSGLFGLASLILTLLSYRFGVRKPDFSQADSTEIVPAPQDSLSEEKQENNGAASE